jgi:hypothetical protein
MVRATHGTRQRVPAKGERERATAAGKPGQGHERRRSRRRRLYLKAAWLFCGAYACTSFDQVEITLPRTKASADVSLVDTLDPSTLFVGPVTAGP